MIGYHVFWSKPAIRKDGLIHLYDFQYLTWLTSIFEWQRNNGRIFLLTDQRGFKFVQNTGLDTYYDGIDALSLNELNSTFWSGAKILGHSLIDCGVILDYDLITWEKIDFQNYDILCLHREDVHCCLYYQNKDTFHPLIKNKNYLNYAAEPLNCSLLFIKNKEIKDFYLKETNSLFNNASSKLLNDKSFAAFLEQWVLGMICEYFGLKVGSLLPRIACSDDHISPNRLLTHLWGTKLLYEKNFWSKVAYCEYLIDFLIKKYNFTNKTIQEISNSLNSEKQKWLKKHKLKVPVEITDLNILGLKYLQIYKSDKSVSSEKFSLPKV